MTRITQTMTPCHHHRCINSNNGMVALMPPNWRWQWLCITTTTTVPPYWWQRWNGTTGTTYATETTQTITTITLCHHYHHHHHVNSKDNSMVAPPMPSNWWWQCHISSLPWATSSDDDSRPLPLPHACPLPCPLPCLQWGQLMQQQQARTVWQHNLMQQWRWHNLNDEDVMKTQPQWWGCDEDTMPTRPPWSGHCWMSAIVQLSTNLISVQ